jgi:hypothetical protein
MFSGSFCFSNPYFDQSKVEVDSLYSRRFREAPVDKYPYKVQKNLTEIIRVDILWDKSTDSFKFKGAYLEFSGTQALEKRSKFENTLGSYKGKLTEVESGLVVGHDSLGTGSIFRKLSRGLSFRFPYTNKSAVLTVKGEHPVTGKMIQVLSKTIEPSELIRLPVDQRLETRLIKEATSFPKLIVNFYAEGYLESRKKQFWSDSLKALDGLKEKEIPLLDHLEFRAVFSPSNEKIGNAKDLGLPIKGRDTFLGLYFPYWEKFGRWYHVVYPTDLTKYRNALGSVPYDYPIILVDDGQYWGVGNYNELTAVPSGNSSFIYLLIHEFGHFLGLNEEYEGGGRTELEFAYEIHEPWSQNMSFLRADTPLKWLSFLNPNTPIPTKKYFWNSSSFSGVPAYGAYRGGYADSKVKDGYNHKPGYSCIMSSGAKLCPICSHGIKQKILFDSGI